MILKKYPTRIIPTVQIAMKMQSSLGFIAFFSIIIDGSESVITPIINARTTPSFAPFATSASAMGIQPKMLINRISEPKSTIGDDIRNENVTPSGSPALVKPINSGIDEHEQKGVTVPSKAAIQFAPMP